LNKKPLKFGIKIDRTDLSIQGVADCCLSFQERN
jgi:hypothetical protein